MRMRPVSFSRTVQIAALLAVGTAVFAGLCAPAAAQIGESIRRMAGKLSPKDAATTETEKGPALVSPDANLELTEASRAGIPLLLMSDEEMRALLGRDPAFVYDPAGREDPMLIPWTHVRVMAEEYHRIAEAAIAASDWEKAIQAYQAIFLLLDRIQSPWIKMKTFDDIRTRATAGLAMIENRRNRPGEMWRGAGSAEEGRLPTWVEKSTTAVIMDGKNSVCLVGPHPLHVGDEIPGQVVKVVVAKIEKNAVHYKVGNEIFIVQVGKAGAAAPEQKKKTKTD